MPVELDDTWTCSPIQIGSKTFTAYRRAGGGINDDSPFINEHLKAVVGQGGLLLRHEHDWKVTEEDIDHWGNKGYKLAPTGTDMWYVPECGFNESLELLGIFGFPGRGVCEEPGRILKLSKALLVDLRRGRTIGVYSVTSGTVSVEHVAGKGFTTEEMTRLLRFNEMHFGIKHSKGEFLDLRRLYRRAGFFILGAM